MRTLALVALALTALALVPTASASEGTFYDGRLPVEVGVHVINIGNYDVNKGTYVMDLYLTMTYPADWAPADFDPAKFEFMNGRASSKELLSDETLNGTREIWWRIQANLYTEPTFSDYPLDHQHLGFQLEHSLAGSDDVQYQVAVQGSGLDPEAKVAGWRIDGTNASTTTKVYPFGETYSRFSYSIEVSREPLSATLRSFLPPLAFVLVSGVSFFFHSSKIAQRITLGTSMLISAVGFHISQSVSLPNLGTLTFFDEVMLACYAFLACSLMVTTAMAYDEDFLKNVDYTKKINRYGALASIVLPVLVFLVLHLA